MKTRQYRAICTTVLAALLLAACGSSNSGSTASSEAAAETVTEAATATESSTASATEEEETPAAPDYLVQAHETNSDVYAWITIPDTLIDFPICHNADDNEYYLTHNAEGEEDEDGAIYTESYNLEDFSDFMTVIYGKNVADRFEPLHDYGDSTFLDAHRNFTITTLDGTVRNYIVFACYINDAYHLLANNDFSSAAVRQEYLYSLQQKNDLTDIIKDDVTPDADSHLVTLMTGITDDDDHRFVVQAMQIEDDTDDAGEESTAESTEAEEEQSEETDSTETADTGSTEETSADAAE